MPNSQRSLKNVLKNFDFTLLLLTIAASVAGIAAISSAVSAYDNPSQYITVQIAALLIGLVGMYFVVVIDYEHLCNLSYIIYGICVILLILVHIPGIGAGLKSHGANRWIVFWKINFQPTEVVKIGFILTFSKHVSVAQEDGINKLKNIALLLLHFGVICVLIMLQPDLGTTIAFTAMFAVMLFFAGVSYKYVIGAIAALGALVPIAWFFVMEEFQKNRIINFLYPSNDPTGTGWQVMQSKIAVGSGQIFGKGMFKGSSHFGFLPERHTDFIFSVISEEFGLIGSLAVFLLLMGIIARCLYIAFHAKNQLGMSIALGVSTMLLFQVFENIGMCIGIMPVTGITLPFISCGGSSLLTNLVAIGLVLNVRYRYKVINF